MKIIDIFSGNIFARLLAITMMERFLYDLTDIWTISFRFKWQITQGKYKCWIQILPAIKLHAKTLKRQIMLIMLLVLIILIFFFNIVILVLNMKQRTRGFKMFKGTILWFLVHEQWAFKNSSYVHFLKKTTRLGFK